MFTVRNTVLVALLQVGLIVFGVLGVRSATDDFSAPVWFSLATQYGPVALVIPLFWTVIVLGLCQRAGITLKSQNRAFLSGIIILLMLGLLFTGLWADASSRWDWGETGDD